MNKTFRLVLHQKGFSDEDLIISQKDYPEACLNNILEIYHPPNPLQQADDENHQRKTECDEESHPRLLLQITSFKDDLVPGKTISVEQSIGATFGLKNYNNVSVKLVDPKEVALDSVELTFRDQYMGRSEMWRLKNNLINTCVYLNKKIEFCGRTIRCQVYEMWSQGIRVACGVINEDTHIVFRSSTAMVYIFLQMSSEMWEFDNLGDLYFEKAVNGFLSELFTKWKKNGSNHEVTIVLFSRTFYQAKSLDEFPLHMKECLQKDYKGRYYEDFYRVPVQNERYDDWSNILVQLRKIFLEYLNTVLNYHERTDIQIPTATNSTAARGNFLEVLNMSLNVFEKHYLDRSFDRTGQLSVVVTPGVGVFEVDRELTNITKQRIIDGGVGSDLVCVGEQPLHAVPLLKFHNKDTQWKVPGDYSMPHWINLSFYSTNKKLPNSDFIPRIKVPSSWLQPKKPNEENKHCNNKKKQEKISDADDCIQNAFFDFDAYDAAVFETPSARHVQDSNTLQGRGHHHHSSRHHQRSSGSLLDSQDIKGLRRKLSDPDIKQYRTDNNQRSEPIAIPSTTTNILPSPQTEDREFSPPMRMVVGSEGSPPHESKALINPFDPSHVTIKLTSNRRRWTHIFPKGPTGVLIQQHHYQAIPAQRGGGGGEAPKEQLGQIPNSYSDNDHPPLVVTPALLEYCKKRPNTHSSSTTSSSSAAAKHHSTTMKSSTFLWGATGEQEWTPALTTVNEVIIGVDWKSLTIPACLPITTDYFPDQRTLDTDYVVSLYTLVPDSVYADFAQPRGTYKKPLTTDEVFRELISQRLAQGFQLILMNKPPPQTVLGEKVTAAATNQLKKNILRKSVAENEETYNLSIGRLFHKISLSGNTISITRYRPRHPYPGFNYQYRYRFHAPYHSNYEESYATFTTEKLEHYNWNYLDHYVCTGGDTTDFVLVDALKYWRFRLYILPFNAAEKECTKKIVEGASRCDIYSAPTATDQNLMVEGFLKFIEAALNKLKRSNNAPKKTRKSISIHQTLPQLLQPRRNSICTTSQNISSSNSPFRERLGSNRLPDRPRPRSGSKVLERTRNSQGSQEQQSSGENIDAPEEGIAALVLLKPNCSSLEIIESFKHPIQGLFFINIPQSTQSFPNYTFVAADAVNWLQLHVEGVNNNERALQIMQNLHKENLIRHASGNVKQQFIYGFFLFYIVPSDNNNKNDKKPSFEDLPLLQTFGDLESFENEFFEVEIKSPLNWGLLINEKNTNTDIGVPHFLCDEIDPEYGDVDDIVYKKLRLETDVANKSERTEWGHARYQTVFRPDRAYEIVAEWLTSSGSIVGELVYGWHRKGQSCGLQLIPIPHDPLALPYSEKSDPLRGPIFVPLNIACLDKGEDYLFKDFSEDSWRARMFLLQEAIVQRFGFLKCLVELPKNSSNNPSREYQYIHGTGTIFILITNTAPPTERSRANSLKEGGSQHQHNKIPNKKYSLHADIVPSPHEAYITRHVSGKNKADYDNSRKMGFLWCWNHMISKRWRTNPAVDSNFQIKVLKDFQAFCNNSEDRLLMFWRESWNAKSEALLH